MNAPEAQRWERVQKLFAAALEAAPDQRQALVARHCGGDAELALEVLSLLAADEDDPNYLDKMAAGLSALVDEPIPGLEDTLIGQKLDRYTIEKKLAHGGMGTVYLARRSDGTYDEQVAVKVIRRGMDSEQVVGRFRVERQILARLRHPNIANLLDGGITEDGRPYLVMEYVEGRPIDVYCREEKLGLTDRVNLMRTVCSAVQHAHSNLVVHRDLKPSNILVTESCRVKLMDFGIAKVLTGDGADAPLPDVPVTVPGLQVLTPGYAAPEQINGGPVTTATDVFGLGIVLYQLLTGSTPFGGQESTAQEIARSTCENDPLRPSQAASGNDPAVTSHRLTGDLDNICLTALRREPERRYQSPGQLADDLERHLQGDPVSARPATLRYRTGKLLSRHRRAFTALAAVLVVSVGLVSFYTARLASERNRALLNEAKAEQVADYLGDMFTLADPDQSRGADITAREILTRGAERVRTGLANQPDVQSQMLDVLGDVHVSLGLFDEGRELLARSLELKRGLYGTRHLETAATAFALGRLEAESGHFAAADSLLSAALEVHRDQLGSRDLAVAADLQGLALINSRQGQNELSVQYYNQAMAIYQADPARQGIDFATCLNDLALQLLEMGRGQEAEPLFRQALEIQRELLGEDHPEVANTLFNLALLFRDRGDFKAAEPIQRQVLALDRQHYDDNHPNLAYSLMSLGGLLTENGQYTEAARNLREALEIRRAILAPSHPDIPKTLGTLALTMSRGGNYTEAEPLLREAVDLAREHLGVHPILAGRLDGLGWLLQDLGRDEEALTLHREALEIKLEVIGPDHKNTGTTYMHLARALQGLGDLEAAEAAEKKAVAIGMAAYGPLNLFTITTELGLARIYLAQKRLDEAFEIALSAVTNMRKVAAADSPRLAGALAILGQIQWDQKKTVEAERSLRQALAIRRERLGPDHPLTAWSQVTLAEFLLEVGSRQEASALAGTGLVTLDRCFPNGHKRVTAARDIAERARL